MQSSTSVRGSSELVERVRQGSRRPAGLGSTPAGAVSLAMGEPFGGTPAPIVAAAVESLLRGRTHYEPMTGSPTLRSELADHLTNRYAAQLGAANVVVTHGASAGLAAAVLAAVNPGDRVVIPEPTYSLYADHVAMAGGVVDWIATSADGRLDLDAMNEAMAGAALVIACSPGNPTGRVITRTDLVALAELAERHDCLLLTDEAYHDIVFDDVEFTSGLDLPQFADRVICCRTFSKSYAMTGWRLGYVVAGERLANAINLVHRSLNGPLNTFVQDAGIAALRLPEEALADMCRAFQERRDLVVEALAPLDFVAMARPQGAFYAFLRVDLPYGSDELTALLADQGLLVRSGREYGPSGEGYLRLSFATDLDTLRAGLERLTTVLRALHQS